ncbi:MAG: DUF993 family protein [Rhizobiales bacterium]|nr:DUF993 family protein [Hyphomicrobiales bacterium]
MFGFARRGRRSRPAGRVILLLNRRGYSTHIQCPACGHVVKCPACDLALTHHRAGDQVICHYCDFQREAPVRCPQCSFDGIRFSGVGTDQLAPEDVHRLDDVVRAYLEQLHTVQGHGGRVIMMASRALARVARSPDDYARVYRRVLAEADHPVILHWLGEMFDPSLKDYWGAAGFERALETALAVIAANVEKIDGIKISLLDDQKEIRMRRLLPAGVRMYTGDDFNYPDLIKGDEEGHSDALLGIFDPIAPAAALALAALDEGDAATYDRLLAPTVPLSRLIFRTPTQYYKTGVVFMAWLNGFQDHFVMIAAPRRCVRSPISPMSFDLQIKPGCCETRNVRWRACGSSWRSMVSRDSRRAGDGSPPRRDGASPKARSGSAGARRHDHGPEQGVTPQG